MVSDWRSSSAPKSALGELAEERHSPLPEVEAAYGRDEDIGCVGEDSTGALNVHRPLAVGFGERGADDLVLETEELGETKVGDGVLDVCCTA